MSDWGCFWIALAIVAGLTILSEGQNKKYRHELEMAKLKCNAQQETQK